jgi:hypothetical protein
MWRTHSGERTKAAGTKIRLEIIGQKILAHLSPEAGVLRAHWLATTSREPFHRPKINGHERRSTRTSGVTTTSRDRIAQRSPRSVNATPPMWGPRNQLARARASGTPSLSFQTGICGAKRPTQASPPSRGPSALNVSAGTARFRQLPGALRKTNARREPFAGWNSLRTVVLVACEPICITACYFFLPQSSFAPADNRG